MASRRAYQNYIDSSPEIESKCSLLCWNWDGENNGEVKSHDREILARCPYCNSEEQIDWGKQYGVYFGAMLSLWTDFTNKKQINADGK
ncbi:hypothetical protein [Candidatus Kuenenia stuttgartiensis]|uniref:hypothetical protein n=1 Tax=Kuenenia stuttgartiensis TaxID=174633 RepID=UPI00146BF7CB|nr:hypothetical protein [Candidatus Kuenenia stuttgartiensis]